MLNTVLTVRAWKSNSHKGMGWEKFTELTVRKINSLNKHVFYMLWGRQAEEYATWIDENRNYVSIDKHPSPLAGQDFLETKCFSTCNEYLELNGKRPINWNSINDGKLFLSKDK